MQVKYQVLGMTDYPVVGVVKITRPVFKFCFNHIFGISEARHFKFRMLIVTEEYSCMHDILPQKGCVESHVTFLNFCNYRCKIEA